MIKAATVAHQRLSVTWLCWSGSTVEMLQREAQREEAAELQAQQAKLAQQQQQQQHHNHTSGH